MCCLLRGISYDIHPAIVRRFLIEMHDWKPVCAKMVEDIAESMGLGIFPFHDVKGSTNPEVIDVGILYK
ncbi:hypothetical protein BH18THE2_BH18THE2_24270 [soil metagenome]